MLTLDFNPATGAYILRVPRGEADPSHIMTECGLDWSVPESTHACAILFTKDPFAAVTFREYATPAARAKLDWIVREIEASAALDSGRHIPLPPDKELIPFQRADVDYIMRRPHALDGDAPGLGKTPTSVAVANEMQAERVLVICPASIRDQWCRRIKEWTTIVDPRISRVTSSRFGVSDEADWIVASYEMARNPGILRALLRQRFDLLIVDEAHYAKTTGAGRSRAIFGYHDHRPADDGESVEVITACLMEVCERTLLLTGTPMPNRPSETYVFFRALNWESIDWLPVKGFRERFNPQSKGKTTEGKVWAHEAEGRLPELQNRLRAHIMCRHLEDVVKHQLKAAFPNPIYDLIYLEDEGDGAIKAAIEAERMLDIDPENLAGADFEILGQVSTVRKMMGLAMAPQVASYLSMLCDGGARKLVVFTWHQEVTDYLARVLGSWGVVWTDGRNTSQKDVVCQAFIQRPDINLLIGNLVTLGTGTDGLQHIASHCLFAEPDWVPGNNDQCVKRLARIGQLSRVMADFFLVSDSMAEKVLAASLRKGGVLHKSLDRTASEMVYAV